MESSNKQQTTSSNVMSNKIYLIVPSMDSYNKVQLIQLHTIAKLPTLGSLKLLLEVVETFTNDFRNLGQDEYEIKFPTYFDEDHESTDKEPQSIELILDVENLQVKNLELYLLNNEAIIVDVEDFELQKVILKRSVKYVTDSLKMTRKDYQKKIDSLIKIHSEEISKVDNKNSSVNLNKSMMHIMSLSSHLSRKTSLEVGRFTTLNRQTTNDEDSSYTSITTYNTPGLNSRNAESAKALHNPSRNYNNLPDNNNKQSQSTAYNNTFDQQSVMFDWRFEHIGKQQMNLDLQNKFRNEYSNAGSYPHESGSRKVKGDSPGMQNQPSKNNNYISPEDLNKTVNPEFIESMVMEDAVKNNLCKKNSQNSINVNYMTLQQNVNKNNNQNYGHHMNEEGYLKNLNYYSNQQTSDHSEKNNYYTDPNQQKNMFGGSPSKQNNTNFKSTSKNNNDESMSLSYIENAMISNIVEESTMQPALKSSEYAQALNQTDCSMEIPDFVSTLTNTMPPDIKNSEYAQAQNQTDCSIAVPDFVSTLEIGDSNQFNPQLNNVCRFEESTFEPQMQTNNLGNKQGLKFGGDINENYEESFMVTPSPKVWMPSDLGNNIKGNYEESFMVTPSPNVWVPSSDLGTNIATNYEESFMINPSPNILIKPTGLGNNIMGNYEESTMITPSQSIFGNPINNKLNQKVKNNESSYALFPNHNIKNELLNIEKKLEGSNKGSNHSKNMDNEEGLDINMQNQTKTYSRKISLDKDQKIEGSKFPSPPETNQFWGLEKKQTLEGIFNK